MVELVFIVIGLIIAGTGAFFWRRSSKVIANPPTKLVKVGYSGDTEERPIDVDGYRGLRWVARAAVLAGVLLAGLLALGSTVYTQGVGEAKVIINLDGTIAGEKLEPGFGVKAPWQSLVDYDLFSQEVLYAGSNGNTPAYSGGTVTGAEITTTVKGVNGGSTQANVDISVTYSISADNVTELYNKYKNQERFTKQVVDKTILTVIRQVPSDYTAIEFRGDKRAEAADAMLDALNAKLNPLGVTVDFVNLQDIRYSEEVEVALKQVEVANQNVLKQEADLRAAEIQSQQLVATATAEAEANRLLEESLTAEILQSRYIEALGKGTVYVVPDGSTPFIGVK